MSKDYDELFTRIGISEDKDKETAINFMKTLFDITIEEINNF